MPIGVVVSTHIEDGDPGDEDANSRTPQVAMIALYGCDHASMPVEKTDELSELSDRYAISKGMTGLAQGAEADARLHGLMATLSLPLVREGRVEVQVEVVPGAWEKIDGVSIEAERITFSRGFNGRAYSWTFLTIEGVPAWRTVSRSSKRRFLVEVE